MSTHETSDGHDRGARDAFIVEGLERIRAVPDSDLRWVVPAVRFSAEPAQSRGDPEPAA